MLQYSELTEVFPNWVNSSSLKLKELEHIIDKIRAQDIETDIKFRVIDGKLEFDNRKLQCVRRKLSGDSRMKCLEVIKKLTEKYRIHDDIIRVVSVMLKGCYKNDNKWEDAVYKIIPKLHFIMYRERDMNILHEASSSVNSQQLNKNKIDNKDDFPPEYTETYNDIKKRIKK